jgi:ABC-type transporter Mla MlaB component
MQVSLDGTVVGLIGVLNEHVDLHSVEAAIMTAHQMASDERGEVSLDLSKVQRANSSGLLQWLRMTKRLKVPLCYVNVPVWLVEQFNMIDEFFDGQVRVESIFAHFYSPDTDSSESRLLKIGTDVPVLEHYRNFSAAATSSEGKGLEPDFDERSYFHFIARHLYKKPSV